MEAGVSGGEHEDKKHMSAFFFFFSPFFCCCCCCLSSERERERQRAKGNMKQSTPYFGSNARHLKRNLSSSKKKKRERKKVHYVSVLAMLSPHNGQKLTDSIVLAG